MNFINYFVNTIYGNTHALICLLHNNILSSEL